MSRRTSTSALEALRRGHSATGVALCDASAFLLLTQDFSVMSMIDYSPSDELTDFASERVAELVREFWSKHKGDVRRSGFDPAPQLHFLYNHPDALDFLTREGQVVYEPMPEDNLRVSDGDAAYTAIRLHVFYTAARLSRPEVLRSSALREPAWLSVAVSVLAGAVDTREDEEKYRFLRFWLPLLVRIHRWDVPYGERNKFKQVSDTRNPGKLMELLNTTEGLRQLPASTLHEVRRAYLHARFTSNLDLLLDGVLSIPQGFSGLAWRMASMDGDMTIAQLQDLLDDIAGLSAVQSEVLQSLISHVRTGEDVRAALQALAA